MSARAFEAFLTRIYVDAAARFKANPRAEARLAGLSDEECAALESTHWVGLEMAARSFLRKRQSELQQNRVRSFGDRLFHLVGMLFKRIRPHH